MECQDITCKSVEFHGLQWTPMEFDQLPWTSTGFQGTLWNLIDFHGIQRNSMEVHGCPSKTMNLYGIPWPKILWVPREPGSLGVTIGWHPPRVLVSIMIPVGGSPKGSDPHGDLGCQGSPEGTWLRHVLVMTIAFWNRIIFDADPFPSDCAENRSSISWRWSRKAESNHNARSLAARS